MGISVVSASKKKRFQEEEQQKQAKLARAQKRKAVKKSALVTAIVALILVGGYAAWTKVTGPGEHDTFAECITANGWTMFGTDWCPHCQRQKQMFGKSFKNIRYVNCDLSGECDKVGVEAYPTWGKDEELVPSGVKELDALAAMTGCALD